MILIINCSALKIKNNNGIILLKIIKMKIKMKEKFLYLKHKKLN